MADSGVMIKVSADTSEITDALNKLDKQMKSIGDATGGFDKLSTKITSVGKNVKSFGDDMSKKISLPLLGVGIASIKLASDLEETYNRISITFGSNAKKVEEWGDTCLKSFGISSGSALDMASHFGDLSVSMGISQDKATGMSEKLTGLAGDLASFKNVSLSTASDALAGIFTGQTRSLKALGIVMTEADLKSFALTQGTKKSYSAMSDSEKVTLRYNYVMAQTAKVQGDFARTSGSTANESRTLKETLMELGEVFGKAILPVITPVIAKINELLLSFTACSPQMKNIILIVGAVLIAVFPLIAIIGQLIIGFGFITSVLEFVIPILTAFGACLSAPIVICALLGVAICLLANYVRANWDKITAWTSKAWGDVKKYVSDAITGMVTGIKSWWASVVDKANAVGTSFNTLVGNIKTSASKILSSITSPFQQAWTTVSGIFNNIKTGFANAFNFKLPHIPLPHLNISGSFSLNPISIPAVSCQWYAKGGVFSQAQTIGVGESGTEAVLPLTNDSTMAMIASAITAHMPDNIKENGGKGASVINNFYLSATVREEGDIQKVSQALLKLQERERRGRGANI